MRSTKPSTDSVSRIALKGKKGKHGNGNTKGKPNTDNNNDGKCNCKENTDHIGRVSECSVQGQMCHKCQ